MCYQLVHAYLVWTNPQNTDQNVCFAVFENPQATTIQSSCLCQQQHAPSTVYWPPRIHRPRCPVDRQTIGSLKHPVAAVVPSLQLWGLMGSDSHAISAATKSDSRAISAAMGRAIMPSLQLRSRTVVPSLQLHTPQASRGIRRPATGPNAPRATI